MHAQSKQLMAAGLFVVFTLTASGLAIHYKGRAEHFRQQYQAAVMETDELREQMTMARRPAPPPPTPSVSREARTGDRSMEDHRALLERIRDLEAELEAQESTIASLRQVQPYTPPRPQQAAAPNDEDPPSRRDRMEELRENDPERYAEIMRRREEMRQRIEDAYARKASHFLGRDLDSMPEAERAEYAQMLHLLSETWQLTDRIQSGELESDDHRDARRTLFRNMRELRPLLENQRDREFYELGRQLGYSEDGAHEFVDYIYDMLDVTSMGGMFPGRRGGGQGRGGR